MTNGEWLREDYALTRFLGIQNAKRFPKPFTIHYSPFTK